MGAIPLGKYLTGHGGAGRASHDGNGRLMHSEGPVFALKSFGLRSRELPTSSRLRRDTSSRRDALARSS
jgi:hypothetical protein